jgi:murein DD-endopeptidase MepM/ murein hydrolase activator NlpD
VTRYAHAQELLVKQGDFVKQSQMIAKVGSTGRSTGPHLHYEVLRDGVTLGKN